MWDELEDYTNNDHFFLSPDGDLKELCNAPKTASGIYLVYELKGGKIRLVYIGSSGKLLSDGTFVKRKGGGMYDEIVNGKQFDKPRYSSWPEKMRKEKIEAFDIYWYETFNKSIQDIPKFIQALILQQHYNMFGYLPEWNVEL